MEKVRIKGTEMRIEWQFETELEDPNGKRIKRNFKSADELTEYIADHNMEIVSCVAVVEKHEYSNGTVVTVKKITGAPINREYVIYVNGEAVTVCGISAYKVALEVLTMAIR